MTVAGSWLGSPTKYTCLPPHSTHSTDPPSQHVGRQQHSLQADTLALGWQPVILDFLHRQQSALNAIGSQRPQLKGDQQFRRKHIAIRFGRYNITRNQVSTGLSAAQWQALAFCSNDRAAADEEVSGMILGGRHFLFSI